MKNNRKKLKISVNGVNADGQFFVKVRYDLPESMNSMVLVPTATGIDHSDKTAETENEEIVLMK